MLAGVVGGMANAQNALGVQEFSETYTIAGRQAASGDVVYANFASDTIDSIITANSYAAIWLIKTSDNC